jgi:hypothetical protein
VLQPDHILEVFYTINWINHHANVWGVIPHNAAFGQSITAVTSKGVQISGAPLTNGTQGYDYRVSSARHPLRKGAALAVARLIVRFRDPEMTWTLSDKGNGTHQLLVGR